VAHIAPDSIAPNLNSLQNSSMRILLLTDSFPPHAGGSREYYNNIYQRLVALGNSEVVVLTKKVPGWNEFDQGNSSPAYRIHRSFKPLNSWKYKELPKAIFPFLQTLWHLLVGRIDIIHAGDLYPAGLIALIIKKIWGLPYLVYCHGEEITQTDRFRFQPKVRDRIYRNADAVVANSEFARQNLLRIGVAVERIFKITPGVDAARFTAMPPRADLVERFGLKDKLVVLTVARLVPRKGHKVAIEAFARICSEFPTAHYLIVGTGPEESRLHAQVKEVGIEARVTFAGFISGEELADIYSLGDVMLMANRQEENGDIEGFGIVFLEANAAGKPVIGGRSGGAVEAVVEGVTGYLVDPDNPEELAEILRRLLLDPVLRTTLGNAGTDRVRDQFKWSSRAEKLDQINRGLINLKASQIQFRPENGINPSNSSVTPTGMGCEARAEEKRDPSLNLADDAAVLRVDQHR
jgi:phosphatidylinositol alpha-1,6-mannosyltransferase